VRSILSHPLASSPGIYLWVVAVDAGYLVEYVGQTGVSFGKRMKDHIVQTLGGNYRICSTELVCSPGTDPGVMRVSVVE